MASINELKDQQKSERMEALNSVIVTEVAALWARLEMAVLQSGIPTEEGNDAIPWLIQCHLAELALGDGIPFEDYMDDAKRAYETVVEEQKEEEEDDEDDEDDEDELKDALADMKKPEPS